jgi:ankyrin repeat protein
MAYSLVREYHAGITPDFVIAARSSLIARFILALVMVLALFRGLGIAETSDARESQLIQAATNGDLVRVGMLLERGTEVDAKDEHGLTPLMWSARRGHVEVARALLLKGADLNAKDHHHGATPLIWAVHAGHVDIVRLLLDKSASYANRFNLVGLLLSRSADVNAKDWDGITPLMTAADRGRLDIVRLLLDKGATVNVQARPGGPQGWTALMSAVYRGFPENTSAATIGLNSYYTSLGQGETSSGKDAQNDYHGILKLLIERGADVDAAWWCWTPLNGAAERGDLDVAKLLLEKGASVKSKDKSGWTPLFEAAKRGHSEVAKLLLEKGADVNAALEDGWTPLIRAGGQPEIVKLFLEKGADVNAKDRKGFTALMNAAGAGRLEGVRLLIERGADLNARHRDGYTALTRARDGGHSEVVKLLLEKGTAR